MADEKPEASSSAQQEVTAESSNTQPAEQPLPSCANCKLPETDPETKPLKPCISCKSVSYCSRDCKKAHFKVHKKVCAAAAQEYAKTAEFKPASRTVPKKDAFRGGLQKWQFDT